MAKPYERGDGRDAATTVGGKGGSEHGNVESYAWHNYRTYISTRHKGRSNLCFADGHAEAMRPQQVYRDNRLWNGLGAEDPKRDPHVPYKYLDGQWRFPGV